ncbi:hypothetical protein D3C79_701380 [compost metagenome]
MGIGAVRRPVAGLEALQLSRAVGQQALQRRGFLQGNPCPWPGQLQVGALAAPLHLQQRVAGCPCQRRAQLGRRGFEGTGGHGDLFEQAGLGQRRARPDPGHLHEQHIERYRGQHRRDDGQGNAPADAVAAQVEADHERLTLALNR